MAGFKRVFTQFPGFNILGNIESVNTIDITPPQNPLGAGTGITCVVGEFERGPFNAPIQVFGASEQETIFGGFGYTYDGEPYVYPVASRSAGTNDQNYWNGNGWIATRNKRFAGLILCRVDNSAGSVEFTKLACLTGGLAPFTLTPNDTLVASVDGGAPVTATFTATQATILGVGGTFPTGFVGGETLEVSIDGAPTQVVVFEAADQTVNQVVDRINGATASNIASVVGGEVQLDSRVFGYSATIEVIGGTAVATLGLPGPAVAAEVLITVAIAAAGLYTFRGTAVVTSMRPTPRGVGTLTWTFATLCSMPRWGSACRGSRSTLDPPPTRSPSWAISTSITRRELSPSLTLETSPWWPRCPASSPRPSALATWRTSPS